MLSPPRITRFPGEELTFSPPGYQVVARLFSPDRSAVASFRAGVSVVRVLNGCFIKAPVATLTFGPCGPLPPLAGGTGPLRPALPLRFSLNVPSLSPEERSVPTNLFLSLPFSDRRCAPPSSFSPLLSHIS